LCPGAKALGIIARQNKIKEYESEISECERWIASTRRDINRIRNMSDAEYETEFFGKE